MNDVIEPQGTLRRRRVVRRMIDQPPPPPPNLARRPRRPRGLGASHSDTAPGMLHIKLSHVYCIISTILALLAIIAAKPSFLEFKPQMLVINSSGKPSLSVEHVARAAAVGVAAKKKGAKDDPDTRDLMRSIQQWWNTQKITSDTVATRSTDSSVNSPPFWSFRWIKPQHNKNKESDDSSKVTIKTHKLLKWIDPTILNVSARTPTDIIDKILTSTARLLAIANFLLTMTYLLHSAVAAWFLGPLQRQDTEQQQQSSNLTNQQGLVVDWSSSEYARERMGGFLVFKLLLISAVVIPDTLDLLILLTWYTILSCMRSLDFLAHATTMHLSALGQPPRSGVVQLLLLVLLCNILAAACCVALFHAAGFGMVLLLTCDCALLAADVLSHILRYISAVLEDKHSQTIQSMEARQLELHTGLHQDGEAEEDDSQFPETENSQVGETLLEDNGNQNSDPSRIIPALEVQEHSRGLDLQMEVLDLAHARRLSILDSAMFALELLCNLLTVGHFCHIWSLHGLQFTLIDGVLALHLHSAISSACKKCAQRRNTHSILRDLDLFPNASDQELSKASLAGDVCCICLNTMSTGGHVKKVHCGHLYHTHCLREVVERAQSLQAAKCPLCRASVLNGGGDGMGSATRTTPQSPHPQVEATNNNPARAHPPPQRVAAERALFQFSTEEIFPSWIPVPAFSFEVVRRQSTPPPSPAPVPPPPPPQLPREEQGLPAASENGTEGSPPLPLPPQQEQEEAQPSFLRRFLVLAGAIPMSPEEEARALAQLVDVFPQFERSDLLRELRARGSAEAVAEAVLMGVFSGVARGG